jgi:hypothetical protein
MFFISCIFNEIKVAFHHCSKRTTPKATPCGAVHAALKERLSIASGVALSFFSPLLRRGVGGEGSFPEIADKHRRYENGKQKTNPTQLVDL